MTLQFPYNIEDKPSSLTLDLKIWNKFGRYATVKGMIDTGADQTAIPQNLVQELDLKLAGKVNVITADKTTTPCSCHYVNIQIRNIKFDMLYVVALPKSDVLIGRDLINLWRLELDGKSKIYTIEPWSTNPEDAS